MKPEHLVLDSKLWVRKFLILFVVLAICFVVNLSLGSVFIPVEILIDILLGNESKNSWEQILLYYRIPKALTAVLAGMALGTSGLQMQTFFKNPLAGPFILGISSGASLGVALLIMAGITFGINQSLALTTVFASVGASSVMLMVIVTASRLRDNMSLLIVGLMFGSAAGALVSVLQFFSQAESIQAYLSWTFGSLGAVTWNEMKLFAPMIIVSLVLSIFLLKPLNTLLLGDNYALSMGIRISHLRIAIVVLTSILAGTVTAFCGPIAFIGVALPHLARLVFNTSDHFKIYPIVLMMGGIVMLLCDTIAQLPFLDLTLPINAVTALFGAPIIIWVILRKRNLSKVF